MDNDFGFKFEIGNVACHVGAPKFTEPPAGDTKTRRVGNRNDEVRYVVLSSLLEKCSGGVQRFYSCRGVLRTGDVLSGVVRFSEVELVASTPFGPEADEPATVRSGGAARERD